MGRGARGGLGGFEGVTLHEAQPPRGLVTQAWADNVQPGPPPQQLGHSPSRFTPTPPSTPPTSWARPATAPKRLPGGPRQVEIGRQRAAKALVNFHTRAAKHYPPLIIPRHPPLAAILRDAQEGRIHTYQTAGKAAINIQRVWRGTHARLRCIKMLEREQAVAERVSEHWMRKASVVRVQAFVRARAQRRAFLVLRRAALIIQRAWRLFVGVVMRAVGRPLEATAEHVPEAESSTEKLPEPEPEPELELQLEPEPDSQPEPQPEPKLERQPEPQLESAPEHANTDEAEMSWAVLRIQTKLRMRVRRREFNHMRKSVLYVQKLARMRRAHFEYHSMRTSALLVQKFARRRRARKEFSTVLSAISTAQRMWRGILGRRKFKSLWDECTLATIMIQSKFRAKVARMRAGKIRHAAVRIQSVQRGRLVRRDYDEIKHGALRMLSDELMEIVFSFLPARSLSSARLVWTPWNKVGQADSLWRQLSTSHYGEQLARATSMHNGWRKSCISMGLLNKVRWLDTGQSPPGSVALPSMPCSRQGHTMTTVSPTEAVLLFGKDGPGTQGDVTMHSTSHYVLTTSTGLDCRMRWDELKIDAAGDWRWQATELPPARWGHTATMINPGLIVVFGGFGEDEVMDDVWLLQVGPTQSDPASHDVLKPSRITGRWIKPEVKGGRPSARAFHSATMVEGVGVVFFGGLGATGRAHRDAFVLTVLPKENVQNAPWRVQWKKAGTCRWPRAGHSAVLHPKRGLFFIGGMTRTREGKDVFRSDACMLRIGAWQRYGARMKWMYTDAGVQLPPRRCMASTLIGSRLLMFGGCESQHYAHRHGETADLLEDKQRLCNDILVTDLNVCFRSMRKLEIKEEQQQIDVTTQPVEVEDVCLYNRLHPASHTHSRSCLALPTMAASVDDEQELKYKAEQTYNVHGSTGGVESAGFAQVGAHFVICGGTTQTNYATLSTLDTLSCLCVH